MDLSQFLSQEEINNPMPAPEVAREYTIFDGTFDFVIEKSVLEEYKAFRPGDKNPEKQMEWDAANPDVVPGQRLSLKLLCLTEGVPENGKKLFHEIVLIPSSNDFDWRRGQGKYDLLGLVKRCGLSIAPATAEEYVGQTLTLRCWPRVSKGKKYQSVGMALTKEDLATGVFRPTASAPAASPNAPVVSDDATPF